MSASVFAVAATKPTVPRTILTATGVGSTSAVTDQGCVVVDLIDFVLVPKLALHVKVTNNGTPPGAIRYCTVSYGFSPDSVTVASAAVQFEGNGEVLVPVALRNTASAVQRANSGLFEASARYLYVWYDISALASSAAVDVSVELVAAG